MDALHCDCAARRPLPLALTALALLVVPGATAGAQSATQVVRFRVVAQSRAEVVPVSRPVSLRSASAAVSTSALSLSTNDASLKVTASIDRALPRGASLLLVLGDRLGNVDGRRLDTAATDVLTGISPTEGSRIPLRYRVDTSAGDASRSGEQRLVTYTVVAAP